MNAGVNTAERAPTDEEYAQMVTEAGGQLVINLDNVAALTFENIPKGIYNVEIEEVLLEKSKQNQPMFTLTVRFLDEPYLNRKMRYWISFAPGALSGTKATLMRLAPELFKGPFNPQEVVDSGSLIGKQVRAKVDIKPYNGEDRSSITALFQPKQTGGSSEQPFIPA